MINNPSSGQGRTQADDRPRPERSEQKHKSTRSVTVFAGGGAAGRQHHRPKGERSRPSSRRAMKIAAAAVASVVHSAGDLGAYAWHCVDEGKASGLLLTVMVAAVVALAFIGLDRQRLRKLLLKQGTQRTRDTGVQVDLPPVEVPLTLAATAFSRPLSSKLTTSSARQEPGLNFRLETLTVEQLRGICRDRGLVVGGNKSDLVARLLR